MATTFFDILRFHNVLFVEDDAVVQTEIGELLEQFFHKVYRAESAEDALLILKNTRDITVLIADILLQQMNGLELVRKLRNQGSDMTVLVITSEKSEAFLLDAVTLKLAGYIVKPLSFRTLKEGLQNCARDLLERGNGGDAFPIGENVLFHPREGLLSVDGKREELSKKEYDFLLFALKNPNLLLSKAMIETHVWNGEEMSEAALKNFLVRLRGKIGKGSIETVKGLGYRLVTHPQDH